LLLVSANRATEPWLALFLRLAIIVDALALSVFAVLKGVLALTRKYHFRSLSFRASAFAPPGMGSF